MKQYRLLLLCFLLIGCGQKESVRKVCIYQTNNKELQVYNDLLIELVEHHFYNIYLGDDFEVLVREIEKNAAPDAPDATAFTHKMVELHNRHFGDSTKFQTIFLTSLRKDAASRFNYFLDEDIWDMPADSGSMQLYLVGTKTNVAQAILTLSQSQTAYSAADFRSCTFKIDDLGEAASFYELEREQKLQAIGEVAFSGIHWLGKGTGMLYYEFSCGGKCGKGEIVTFGKANGRWGITKKLQLWTA